MKRLMRFLIVAGAIFVLGMILNQYLASNRTEPQTAPAVQIPPPVTLPGPGASPSPATNPPANVPTPPVTATPPPPAVAAAAVAVDVLSSAQFMPQPQMEAYVDNLVVPEQRPALKAAFASSGSVLARIMGYTGALEANDRANYYTQTERYKLDIQNGETATVSLFTVSHWVTAAGQEFRVPAINVVQMKLVGQNWLYVQSDSPPAGQLPPPAENLSYAETLARFQPYLEGYTPYVSEG